MMAKVLAFVHHAQGDGQIPESDAGGRSRGKVVFDIGSSL